MHLHWSEDDEHGLLLEFITDNLRFGISFENDLSESSWHFVSKTGEMASCALPEELLSALANRLTTRAVDLSLRGAGASSGEMAG